MDRVGFVDQVGGSAHEEEMISEFRYSISKQLKNRIKFGKMLRDLRKIWKFSGGRLEHLAQLLHWTLWLKVNKIQIKIRIQFCSLNSNQICTKLIEREITSTDRARLHEFNPGDVIVSCIHHPIKTNTTLFGLEKVFITLA
jgi:hypothetical protein